MGKLSDVYKMKAKGDIKGLVKALGCKDSLYVRKDAASALGELGDPRAIEPLVAALGDSSYDVCLMVIRALARFGTPVVDTLSSLLKVPQLADEAARALGRIGDPRAVEPLSTYLEMGGQIQIEIAVAALEKIGTPALDMLISKVQASNVKIRKEAIEALGKIGDARAVEPLIAALEDINNRLFVIETLRVIGDRRAIEPLIRFLKDKERPVRQATAKALDKLGWKPDSVEREVDYSIARGDFERCVKIGTPAMKSLMYILQDKHSGWLRKDAARALGSIGDPQAIGSLCIALREEDVSIVNAAAEALGEIGTPEAIRALWSALMAKSCPKLTSNEVIGVLGKVGTQALEFLLIALKDENIGTRRCAAEELAKIEHPQVLTAFLNRLGDKDEDVLRTAVSVMEKQGDAQAVIPLVELAHDERVAEPVIKALCSVLRRHANEVDTEVLHTAVNIDKVVHLWVNPHYCANEPGDVPSERHNVDTSEVRQLARQELIRRGLQA